MNIQLDENFPLEAMVMTGDYADAVVLKQKIVQNHKALLRALLLSQFDLVNLLINELQEDAKELQTMILRKLHHEGTAILDHWEALNTTKPI